MAKPDPFAVLASAAPKATTPAAPAAPVAAHPGGPPAAPSPAMEPTIIVALHLIRRLLPAIRDDVSFQIAKKMIAPVAGEQYVQSLGAHYNPQMIQQAMAESNRLMAGFAARHVLMGRRGRPTPPAAPRPAPAPAAAPAAPGPVGLASMGGGQP